MCIQINDICVSILFIFLFFSICDAFMNLCRRMFPDSQIAAAMTLKRLSCIYLTQMLGDFVASNLAAKLRTNKFSIVIDKSTDRSVDKACALIVKFYDQEDQEMKTGMLDLINVHEGNQGSSGESLFNIIINSLNSFNIPTHNLIGFAGDGAANLMGNINSVTSRIRIQMPGVSIFKCGAHSIHICSSEAAKTLPGMCEKLI